MPVSVSNLVVNSLLARDGQDFQVEDADTIISGLNDGFKNIVFSLDRNAVPYGIVRGLSVSYNVGDSTIRVASGGGFNPSGRLGYLSVEGSVPWVYTADVGKYVCLRTVSIEDPASSRENLITHVLENMYNIIQNSVVLVASPTSDDLILTKITAASGTAPVFGDAAAFTYGAGPSYILRIVPKAGGSLLYGFSGNKYRVRFFGQPGSSLVVSESVDPAGIGGVYLDVQLACDALGNITTTYSQLLSAINALTYFYSYSSTPSNVVDVSFLSLITYQSFSGGNGYYQDYQAPVGSVSFSAVSRFNGSDPFSKHLLFQGSGTKGPSNPHGTSLADLGVNPLDVFNHIRREHTGYASIPRYTSPNFLFPELTAGSQNMYIFGDGSGESVSLVAGHAYAQLADYQYSPITDSIRDYNLYAFFVNNVGTLSKQIIATYPQGSPLIGGDPSGRPSVCVVDKQDEFVGTKSMSFVVSASAPFYTLQVGGGPVVDVSAGGLFTLFDASGKWVRVFVDTSLISVAGSYIDSVVFSSFDSRDNLPVAYAFWRGEDLSFGFGGGNQFLDKRRYGSFEAYHDRSLILHRNTRNALVCESQTIFDLTDPTAFAFKLNPFEIERKGSSIHFYSDSLRTVTPSSTTFIWVRFINAAEFELVQETTFIAHDLENWILLGKIVSDGSGITSVAAYPLPAESVKDQACFLVETGSQFKQALEFANFYCNSGGVLSVTIEVQKAFTVTGLGLTQSIQKLRLVGRGHEIIFDSTCLPIEAVTSIVFNEFLARIQCDQALFKAGSSVTCKDSIFRVDLAAPSANKLFSVGSSGTINFDNSFVHGLTASAAANMALCAAGVSLVVSGGYLYTADCSSTAENVYSFGAYIRIPLTGITGYFTAEGGTMSVTLAAVDSAGSRPFVSCAGSVVTPFTGKNQFIADSYASILQFCLSFKDCVFSDVGTSWGFSFINNAAKKVVSFDNCLFASAVAIDTWVAAGLPPVVLYMSACRASAAMTLIVGSAASVAPRIYLSGVDFTGCSINFGNSTNPNKNADIFSRGCVFDAIRISTLTAFTAEDCTFIKPVDVTGRAAASGFRFVRCVNLTSGDAFFKMSTVGRLVAALDYCTITCTALVLNSTVGLGIFQIVLSGNSNIITQSANFDFSDSGTVSPSSTYSFDFTNTYFYPVAFLLIGVSSFVFVNCFNDGLSLGYPSVASIVSNSTVKAFGGRLDMGYLSIEDGTSTAVVRVETVGTEFNIGAPGVEPINVTGAASCSVSLRVTGGYVSANINNLPGNGSFDLDMSSCRSGDFFVEPVCGRHPLRFDNVTFEGSFSIALDETNGYNIISSRNCTFKSDVSIESPHVSGALKYTTIDFISCFFTYTDILTPVTFTIDGELLSAGVPSALKLFMSDCVFDPATIPTVVSIKTSYSSESIAHLKNCLYQNTLVSANDFSIQVCAGKVWLDNCLIDGSSSAVIDKLVHVYHAAAEPFSPVTVVVSGGSIRGNKVVYVDGKYDASYEDVIELYGNLSLRSRDAVTYASDDAMCLRFKAYDVKFSTSSSYDNPQIIRHCKASGVENDTVSVDRLFVDIQNCVSGGQLVFRKKVATVPSLASLSCNVTAVLRSCDFTISSAQRSYSLFFLACSDTSVVDILASDVVLNHVLSAAGSAESLHSCAGIAVLEDYKAANNLTPLFYGSIKTEDCDWNTNYITGTYPAAVTGWVLLKGRASLGSSVYAVDVCVQGLDVVADCQPDRIVADEYAAGVVMSASYGGNPVVLRGDVAIENVTLDAKASAYLAKSFWHICRNIYVGASPATPGPLLVACETGGTQKKHGIVSVSNVKLSGLTTTRYGADADHTVELALRAGYGSINANEAGNHVSFLIDRVIADSFSKVKMYLHCAFNDYSNYDYPGRGVVSVESCHGLYILLKAARQFMALNNKKLRRIWIDCPTSLYTTPATALQVIVSNNFGNSDSEGAGSYQPLSDHFITLDSGIAGVFDSYVSLAVNGNHLYFVDNTKYIAYQTQNIDKQVGVMDGNVYHNGLAVNYGVNWNVGTNKPVAW